MLCIPKKKNGIAILFYFVNVDGKGQKVDW